MEPKRNKVSYFVGGLLAVILVVVLAFYVMSLQNKEQLPVTQTMDTAKVTNNIDTQTPTASEATPASEAVTIVFSNSGFDKSSYTVKKGQVVTVKNTSSSMLEFASDNHPTHRVQPELNTDPTAAGSSTTLTPTKVGTYGFHDHLNSQFTGTLVVTE